MDEDDLTSKLLVEKVQELYFTRLTYINAMSKSSQRDAISTIISILENIVTERTN